MLLVVAPGAGEGVEGMEKRDGGGRRRERGEQTEGGREGGRESNV